MCINYLEGLQCVYLNSNQGQNIVDYIRIITREHSCYLGSYQASGAIQAHTHNLLQIKHCMALVM